MLKSVRWFSIAVVTAMTLLTTSTVTAQEEKWVSLFDGKTLEGWEKIGKDTSKWEVKEGALAGSGEASMLVNTTGPY